MPPTGPRSTKAAGLVLIALLLSTISACSQRDSAVHSRSSQTATPRTVAEAKKAALSMEATLAAAVPAELVVKKEHLTKTNLLGCPASENEFIWPGQMGIDLKPGIEPRKFTETVAEHWNERTGFTAVAQLDPDGDPQVVITAEDGGSYYLDFWSGARHIEITSFSPCFSLPEGDNGEPY